jgi:flagellar biosynthesis protein FlhG
LERADDVLMVTTPEPTSITDSYAAMKVLFSHSQQTEVTLVANECQNPAQAAAVARGLDEICRRFLGVTFRRYEYLPSDPAVALATRRQQPLAIDSSHSAFAQWLRKIAIKLDSRMSRIIEDCENYDVLTPQISPFELVEA